MKLNKIIGTFAIIASSLSLVACGQSVNPGHVGVMIAKFGSNTGIHPEPLGVGWHGTGIGETIIEFPSITKTYQWTAKGDGDNADLNEEITFSDKNALPMSADVSVTLSVNPAMAAAVYGKFNLTFDQLLNGPVRSQVRTAISQETEKMSVEELYSGGRQAAINRALVTTQKYFNDPVRWGKGGSGINVEALNWIGAPRYPAIITEALKARTKADADASAAQAQVAVAKAQADAIIEKARGEAEANKLLAQSVAQNPALVQLKWIEKWNGQLPQYQAGNGSTMVQMPSK